MHSVTRLPLLSSYGKKQYTNTEPIQLAQVNSKALNVSKYTRSYYNVARRMETLCSNVSFSPSRDKIHVLLRMISSKISSIKSRNRIWRLLFPGHRNSSFTRNKKIFIDSLSHSFTKLRLVMKKALFGDREKLNCVSKAKIFRYLFEALTIFEVCLLRARRTINEKHTISSIQDIASKYVSVIVSEQTEQIAAQLNEKHTQSCRLIQKTFRKYCQRKIAAQEQKMIIVQMLEVAVQHINKQDVYYRSYERECRICTTNLLRNCFVQAAERIAAGLIQRIWRGYCGRNYALQTKRKMEKFKKKKIAHERLQKAKAALIKPQLKPIKSPVKINRISQANISIKPMPVIRDRKTFLDPLPVQKARHDTSPSDVLMQRVPFTKFARIRDRQANVNLQRLWVAIPIALRETEINHEELQNTSVSICTEQVLQRPMQRKHMKWKPQPFYSMQYDWVQASLLQSTSQCPQDTLFKNTS